MNWLYYLAEANLYLGIFYLAYCLFLNKETYYLLNRAYLLFSCVISFVLPVVQIGALKQVNAAVTHTVTYVMPVQTQVANTALTTPVAGTAVAVPVVSKAVTKPVAGIAMPVVATEQHFSVQHGLWYAYLAGAVILLLTLATRLYHLFRLTRGKYVKQDEYKLVYLDGSGTAFSFFNYLFIGTLAPGADTIIRHELVHIRQKHSVDIVFLEVLKIINWFNPCIYLLQNSLKTVHEYIADEQTIGEDTDALAYSSFLIDNAYGAGGITITNSFFNYNLLKRRIMMLNQQRSGNLARLKYLVAVPICAGLLCASTLAFSKTYGWVDLAPLKVAAKPKHTPSHTLSARSLSQAPDKALIKYPPPIIKKNKILPPVPPARLVKAGITDKGYKYEETAFLEWDTENNPDKDYQVVITEKNGLKKRYLRNVTTGVEMQLLWDKFGYVFPVDEVQTMRFIGNIRIDKEPELNKRYLGIGKGESMMIRPQLVHIQVDSSKGFDTEHKHLPFGRGIPIGTNGLYLVNGKIYTHSDLERRSAAISTKTDIKTLFSAEYVIYHPHNNKEDIDKYGPMAEDGIYEFVNVRDSKL